jgi:hypothetical protein
MCYLTLILEKIIQAIVSLVVSIFPSLITNFPIEASARAELVKLRDRANPMSGSTMQSIIARLRASFTAAF